MSRSFKKEHEETKKQLREKGDLADSLEYNSDNLTRIYSTYYHLSVAKFEIDQILEPIEPHWVSSDQSESAVVSHKMGIFTTSKAGLVEWFPLIQEHYKNNQLFLYEVRPLVKWSAEDCSIRSVDLEQYFIHCPVEIVSVNLASEELILDIFWNDLLENQATG